MPYAQRAAVRHFNGGGIAYSPPNEPFWGSCTFEGAAICRQHAQDVSKRQHTSSSKKKRTCVGWAGCAGSDMSSVLVLDEMEAERLRAELINRLLVREESIPADFEGAH